MEDSCNQFENFERIVSTQETSEFKKNLEHICLNQKEHCVKCRGEFVDQRNHLLTVSALICVVPLTGFES